MNIRIKRFVFGLWATIVLSVVSEAQAQINNSEETIKQLIEQVAALTKRVQQLEKSEQYQSDIVQTNKSSSARSAIADRVKFKGDFRLRYENIDDESREKDRDRSRVRARIEAVGQVRDDWVVGIGLASGGEDPVSSNQTLGNGGSTKGINLDLAYFDWSGLSNTHLIGGKFKNPFYKPSKHSLIWDGDYRPEGLAFKYDSGSVFANAAFMFLESDNKAGAQDAKGFWGSQIGVRRALGGSAKLTAGVSYYDFGVAGREPFFDDDSFGNTLINNGTSDVYLNDYQELELFAELAFNAGRLPARVFVDWVQNQGADNNENGYAVGATLGMAKEPGSWKATYIYQDLEADSVFGLTTDSDFGGGGTNSSGHIIRAAYVIQKNVSLNFSLFNNIHGDADTDYDRLQLDFSLKY